MKKVEQEYFNWLFKRFSNGDPELESLHDLFECLHSIPFEWHIPMDENRKDNGEFLRYRYGHECRKTKKFIDNNLFHFPCSVLEMLCRTSLDCEEMWMSNTKYGNRVHVWLKVMITNMSLLKQTDGRMNPDYVNARVKIMMDRSYNRDGSGGGLFVTRDPSKDMRFIEIWYQLCAYLNENVDE